VKFFDRPKQVRKQASGVFKPGLRFCSLGDLTSAYSFLYFRRNVRSIWDIDWDRASARVCVRVFRLNPESSRCFPVGYLFPHKFEVLLTPELFEE
jgi:hypothetical protein